jgi:hypothetical protein
METESARYVNYPFGFFFFFPSCVFCSAWVLSSILFMVRVLMQPLPFRKVVVGFTVDSLQGVCILDVSCSRQHGCLGWGGGEVGVCRFKEWEFKAFFFFLFVGGSRGGRFRATIMAVIRKKIVQVCEGGAFDERVNIGSSHTCWHTVWYSCLFVCVSVSSIWCGCFSPRWRILLFCTVASWNEIKLTLTRLLLLA